MTGHHPDRREARHGERLKASGPPARGGPGPPAGAHHRRAERAYPSHTANAATSMMTVTVTRSRSPEFIPQNGRTEGDNSRYWAMAQ